MAYDWTQISSLGTASWFGVSSSSDGSKLAACGTNINIYTSADGGENWTERTSSGVRRWVDIASSSDGNKLIAAVTDGFIYTSSDGGANWTERTSASVRQWRKVASSSDGNTIMAIVSGGIHISYDGGVSWSYKPPTPGVSVDFRRALTSSSDASKLAIGDYGGYIYTSNDSGDNWIPRTSAGSRLWYTLASSSDGSTLVAGGNSTYIYTSNNGGVSWTEHTSLGIENWWGSWVSNDGLKMAVGINSGYVYVSDDGGSTWNQQTSLGSKICLDMAGSDDLTTLILGTFSDYIYVGDEDLISSSSSSSSIDSSSSSSSSSIDSSSSSSSSSIDSSSSSSSSSFSSSSSLSSSSSSSSSFELPPSIYSTGLLNDFYTVDPATGNRTLIGNFSVTQMRGLHYDSVNDKLYGNTSWNTGPNWYEIDRLTGANTFIAISPENFSDSTVVNGIMYAVPWDSVYRVDNPATASFTYLYGTPGYDPGSAIVTVGDVTYIARGDRIYEFDLQNGNTISSVALSGDFGDSGLRAMVNYNDEIYAVAIQEAGGVGYLTKVNPVTGVCTGVNPMGAGKWLGLATDYVQDDVSSSSSSSSIDSSSSSGFEIGLDNGESVTIPSTVGHATITYIGDPYPAADATVSYRGVTYRVQSEAFPPTRFVWDHDNGQRGRHIFTSIGDTIYRHVNGYDFSITWSGEGSFIITFDFGLDVSSSSSSADELPDAKLIPFTYEIQENYSISSFALNGSDIYAGTSNGKLLKSSDVSAWNIVLEVDDYSISALLVDGDKLYIGTAPQGKVYVMDLNTSSTTLNANFGETISDFVIFNNNLYLAAIGSSKIYKYDSLNIKWDLVYETSIGNVSKVIVVDELMYVIMSNSTSIVAFDGDNWNLKNINVFDNVASFRSVSTEPYSHTTDSIIQRSDIKTSDGLSNEDILDIFPYNRMSGLLSATVDSDNLIVGSQNNGKIFSINNNMEASLIFETDKERVHDLLNVDSDINLAAIDNRLYLVRNSSDTNDGIPLLDFNNNEEITQMTKYNDGNLVLIGTSFGRILSVSTLTLNAYLAGERQVYAEVEDGFGNASTQSFTTVFYQLMNKIIEINQGKESIQYKFVEDPSAIKTDRLNGIFVSPIIKATSDSGFWKQLVWRESKPENTNIVICIRTGKTEAQLKAKDWDICFSSSADDYGYGATGSIVRSLDDIDPNDNYIQFKISMTSDAENVSPSVLQLGITYVEKFAVYFYTMKFVMEEGSNLKKGFITANVTQPQNTEIVFGISETNSGDFEDYQRVEVDKLFEMDNFNRLKVGIKLMSYDADNYPEVAEFAVISAGDKNTLINQG